MRCAIDCSLLRLNSLPDTQSQGVFKLYRALEEEARQKERAESASAAKIEELVQAMFQKEADVSRLMDDNRKLKIAAEQACLNLSKAQEQVEDLARQVRIDCSLDSSRSSLVKVTTVLKEAGNFLSTLSDARLRENMLNWPDHMKSNRKVHDAMTEQVSSTQSLGDASLQTSLTESLKEQKSDAGLPAFLSSPFAGALNDERSSWPNHSPLSAIRRMRVNSLLQIASNAPASPFSRSELLRKMPGATPMSPPQNAATWSATNSERESEQGRAQVPFTCECIYEMPRYSSSSKQTHVAGIGLALMDAGDGQRHVYVQGMLEGGAACRDGTIRVGDVIRAVDGDDIAGLEHSVVRSKVVGAAGTTVRLRLTRSDGGHGGGEYEVSLVRGNSLAFALDNHGEYADKVDSRSTTRTPSSAHIIEDEFVRRVKPISTSPMQSGSRLARQDSLPATAQTRPVGLARSLSISQGGNRSRISGTSVWLNAQHSAVEHELTMGSPQTRIYPSMPRLAHQPATSKPLRTSWMIQESKHPTACRLWRRCLASSARNLRQKVTR